MRRILLLIFIAGIAFLIILFTHKPGLIEEIWIWLLGLTGAIIGFFKRGTEHIKDLLDNELSTSKDLNDNQDAFKGTTLKLLRIFSDGESTIGNLFVNDSFFCYTLEDGCNRVKIPGKTRIPKGKYLIDFKKETTPLTQKFRDSNPQWFIHHLEIKNVPRFDSIYIHNGGTHADTVGCILVSDSLQIENKNRFLTNSKETFKRLYLFLSQQINNGIGIQIIIHDEDWINKLNAEK